MPTDLPNKSLVLYRKGFHILELNFHLCGRRNRYRYRRNPLVAARRINRKHFVAPHLPLRHNRRR